MERKQNFAQNSRVRVLASDETKHKTNHPLHINGIIVKHIVYFLDGILNFALQKRINTPYLNFFEGCARKLYCALFRQLGGEAASLLELQYL